MGQIEGQVHGKFKVFAGVLDADNTIGSLADEVAKFARESQVAAKSIGVEYIESVKRIIITLGYRDDEPAYPIKLNCVALGKVDLMGDDFSNLEQVMASASQQQSNIICHELYVTSDNELLMVFMTHQQ